MRSRIPAGLAMMVTALMLSLVPAATVSILPARALSSCDRAQFIADVTVPDGTNVLPGLTFAKTWRLKNIGTCTWTTSYTLVFASGDALGGSSVNLPSTVVPGQTVDVSVSLTAPEHSGPLYRILAIQERLRDAVWTLAQTATRPGGWTSTS